MMGASKFLLQPRINTASKSPKNLGSKNSSKNPSIYTGVNYNSKIVFTYSKFLSEQLNLINFVLERFNQLK